MGTFLDNPEQVPGVVVDYVAEQLDLSPAEFAGYDMKETRCDHQEQMREGYGYTKFEFDQWFALARWMYQRARIGSERPTLLFDLATKRLVEKKVVLPGVAVLERLLSGSRERAEKRLWATLAAAPTQEQAAALQRLVVVPAGKRLSELGRLRRSPRDITARGVGKVMERYEALNTFGGTAWDLPAIPPDGSRHWLVHFARAARAQAVSDLAGDRRLATLVAFAAVMPQVAADEAIEVLRPGDGRPDPLLQHQDDQAAAADPQRPGRRRDPAARDVDRGVLGRRRPFKRHPRDARRHGRRPVPRGGRDGQAPRPGARRRRRADARRPLQHHRLLPARPAQDLRVRVEPGGRPGAGRAGVREIPQGTAPPHPGVEVPARFLTSAWRRLVFPPPADARGQRREARPDRRLHRGLAHRPAPARGVRAGPAQMGRPQRPAAGRHRVGGNPLPRLLGTRPRPEPRQDPGGLDPPPGRCPP
ncbi:hypothetical protein DRB96_29615 [Streptomyces sp. ICC1]|nr:hypothetical protein DRB89_29045 [Streptomyces sp. ICC4]AWZ18317.1 hypothetical protein DRB96_29615 [Streptomyces sp. ICC1]